MSGGDCVIPDDANELSIARQEIYDLSQKLTRSTQHVKALEAKLDKFSTIRYVSFHLRKLRQRKAAAIYEAKRAAELAEKSGVRK